MKILIDLHSPFFSQEERETLEKIVVFWHFPVLPRIDEHFDFDKIVREEYWPIFYKGNLVWHVNAIEWTMREDEIIPVIFLFGEY